MALLDQEPGRHETEAVRRSCYKYARHSPAPLSPYPSGLQSPVVFSLSACFQFPAKSDDTRAHTCEGICADLAHYMDAIEQIGFRDLWRHRHPDRREYSWFSTRNNGFRIDHAFLSQELAACAGTVHYSHKERVAGLSDHSPLILELAGDGAGPPAVKAGKHRHQLSDPVKIS